MTPEELAHWNYQLNRLDGIDVDDIKRALPAMIRIADEIPGIDANELARLLTAMLNSIDWLREEARYKIELGEVLRRTGKPNGLFN